MQSKTSFSDFFSKALFRKNLTRYIPLWGWYLAVLLISLPLVILFSGLSSEIPHTRLDTAAYLYAFMTRFGPFLAGGIGICSAMAVFSYLFSARSIGMVHALPIQRSGLFLTNYLSGLLMPMAANTIAALLVFLAQLGLGVVSISPVLELWLSLNGMLLFFYSFAVFCAMFTGQILALPVFYLILNFLSAGLCWLLSVLISRFQYGLSGFYLDGSAFSPLFQLLTRFRSWEDTEYVEIGNLSGWSVTGCGASGWHWVALYAVVGIVFAALAYLVYRRRASETAGDLITVRWAAVLFRFGVGVSAALSLGFLVYSLFYFELFSRSSHDSLIALAICMMLTGLVGYFSAEMLLNKTIHVFRRGWRGAVALLVLLTVITVCIGLDPLNLAGYVPDEDEIQSVTVHTSGANSIATSDPEIIAQVTQLHRAIADDLDTLRQLNPSTVETSSNLSWSYLSLYYTLEDGSRVNRSYDLPFDPEQAQTDAESYSARLVALYQSPAVLEETIALLEDMNVSDVSFSLWDEGWNYLDDQETMLKVRNAVVEDLRAGRISLFTLDSAYETAAFAGSLELNGWIPNTADYQDYFYQSFVLSSSATATLSILSQLDTSDFSGTSEDADPAGQADYTITEASVQAETPAGGSPLLRWSNALLELPGQGAVNQALRSDYDTREQHYDSYLEAATADYQSRAADGFTDAFLPYEVTRTVHLGRLDDTLVSVRYEDTANTGGAHPETSSLCATYSLQTGAPLTLDTLATDPEQLQAAVSAELGALTAQPQYDGVFFDGYEQLLGQALSGGSWYLTDQGLTLVFDPASIAPYSAGVQQFTIPYASLDGLVQPQWIP